MSINNNSSGSLYPPNSVLQKQFHGLKAKPKIVENKQMKGGVAPINAKVFVDLPRLGNLEVNDQPIYKNGGIFSQKDTDASRVQHVFDKIVEKLGGLVGQANGAVHLLQQDLGGGTLKRVIMKKGYTYRDSETGQMISTHAAVAKRHHNVIKTKGENFKVIHEELVQVIFIEDPEQMTFFKVKTVVEGKLKDLAGKNADHMTIKAAYTKEYSTMKEALLANYWGTRAGGWSDTESYIKA